MNKFLLPILFLGFILRVAYLDKFPIGLYSDEAVFGYNAYLLIQTGHDEYNRFWPVSLESFGDWKPPMQAWLAIPFIKFFGLNEFAVRLPSAILGTATVAIIYFLAEILLRPGLAVARPGLFRNAPLAAALLLAINPWHIFMSRIAMLVAVEVFFVSLGVLGLLKGRRKKEEGKRNINWWWAVAAVSFSGAIYSYYGSRVTVPLILVIFTLVYFNELKSRLKELLVPIAVGTILLLPLVFSAFKNPLFLTGRVRTTSIFFNDTVRLQLWDAHTKAGLKKIPPLISRFFDNKPYYYTKDILERYWSHFSPVFLFLKGDSQPPFKIPGLGYLHLIDLPFFVLGLWKLRDVKGVSAGGGRWRLFLILYLLVSPFVASLTFLTPAANRSFNLVIPWTIITAYGLMIALKYFQESPWRTPSRFLIMAITILYLSSLVFYFYSYIKLIPLDFPHYWHYGRKELVSKLKPLLAEYDKIYLTNKGGPPYIFLAFYLPIQPNDFYKSIKRNPIINELGWGHTDKILNVEIPREFNWKEVPKDPQALYIGFENEIPEDETRVLDRIYYPNGKTAYLIATLKP